MISKKYQNKISLAEFQHKTYYFGIAVQPQLPTLNGNDLNKSYNDIECFFLEATYNLKTSRLTEGFLCWLLQFGHLLSPSKVRRLIKSNYFFDSAVLGSFVDFLQKNDIMSDQWKIITPYCKKRKQASPLLDGPMPRLTSPYFIKYGILAPQFKLEISKFIRPVSAIYEMCAELKNRALFGSVVNADVFSYLKKYPDSTAYQVAQITHHHKARVFEVFPDILAAG